MLSRQPQRRDNGRIDGEGRLEAGTHAFKVVLGDDEGNIIDLEVWKATRILHDNRILPKGYADVRIDFQVPADLTGELVIKADLCYHSFSQAFVDHLLGKEAPRADGGHDLPLRPGQGGAALIMEGLPALHASPD